MRLPLVASLSTKNGISNKNARMTNVLKESKKTGDMAVVRPGLTLNATASGVGNGLVVFNGELVSVYGTTLGLGAPGESVFAEFNLTGGNFDILGVSWLGSDEWCMFGDDGSDSHVYTGDANGSMSLDESGFDTTQETRSGVWYINLIATSGTSVVIAKRESLQYSALPTPLDFSEVQDNSYDYFQEVKYMGSKYVAISWNFDTGNAIHWSDDDGATWDVYESSIEEACGCFDGTNWCFFSVIAGSGTWWVDTTTDFASYTHDELVLTPTPSGAFDASIICASYSGGYFYISFFGDFGAVNYATYYSVDGINFNAMSVDIRITRETESGLIGIAGDEDAVVLYSIQSGLATVIESGLHSPFAGAANDDMTVIVLGDQDIVADAYYRLGVSQTITSLGSVTGSHFDFAQGVL